MNKSRDTEEQISYVLQQAVTGTPVAEVTRRIGISEKTFYRWKKFYAGLMPSEMRRLRQLEDEKAKLKRLVADLSLDKAMLQDVVSRKHSGLIGGGSSSTTSGASGSLASVVRNRADLQSGGLRHARRIRRARDGDARARSAGCGLDLCVELLCQRLDDIRAQARRADRVGLAFADTIVGNHKLPIGTVEFEGDEDQCAGALFRKGIFYGVNHQFGDDQADAYSFSGIDHCGIGDDLYLDRLSLADHGVGEPGAKFSQIGIDGHPVDHARGVEVRLNGGNRHDTLVRVQKMLARFDRTDAFRFQH